MKQRRNLIQLLYDRKRIEMNSKHRNRVLFGFFLLILVLSLISISYITLASVKSTTATFMFLLGTTITSLGLVIFCYHKIRSITIIGDNIILNSLQNNNEVTNIQSVRSVTSRKLMNMYFTFIHYRLDGNTKKIFAVINSNHFRTSPENTFRKALQFSQKGKERANHKPGSVL